MQSRQELFQRNFLLQVKLFPKVKIVSCHLPPYSQALLIIKSSLGWWCCSTSVIVEFSLIGPNMIQVLCKVYSLWVQSNQAKVLKPINYYSSSLNLSTSLPNKLIRVQSSCTFKQNATSALLKTIIAKAKQTIPTCSIDQFLFKP